MATFRSRVVRIVARCSALWKRQEVDDRVAEELAFHLRMQTEENIRRGMAPKEAQAAARRQVGNTTQVREEVRRMSTVSFLAETLQDVRFSLRTIRRNPGFALATVLVLALGLGASTAMFSALDRMLFRPLPYADADRLVNIGMIDRNAEPPVVLFPEREYRERWKPAPEPFAAVTTASGHMRICDVTERNPEFLPCTSVESNFLQTFGVRPILGRDFTPEDDVRGAPPVALISQEVWTRRFGADPDAIGRTIDLNGSPVRVVGVLPAGFAMPTGEVPGILEPLRNYPLLDPQGTRALGNIPAFGRLKPGATPEQAGAAITTRIEPLLQDALKGRQNNGKVDFQPQVTPLRDYLVGDSARLAWLLLGAVAGLLLIACVNVTNLVLARLAARDREFAVRWSLGAGRARLSRLALIESLLLALAGGALGLFFATVLLQVFVQLAPPNSIPESGLASVDLRVVSFAAVLAVAVGVAVGIWPTLAVLRSRALQYGPRATSALRPRMRFTLVTAQIALTVTLLTGSALLLRTLWNLVSVPLGYQSEGVITMGVHLLGQRHPQGSNLPNFDRILERIREIPGTTDATMTYPAAPPAGNFESMLDVLVDHEPDSRAKGLFIRMRFVTPGYFRLFSIPILRGRTFEEADHGLQPPRLILSESAARILFGSQDPIGHTVGMGGGTGEWGEVVGVAGDVRNNGLVREPDPEIYMSTPRKTAGMPYAFFAIRTQANTADAIALMEQAVTDVDPRVPVTVEPLSDEVARLTERTRFIAWLLSAFAGLALLLAAAGLYGVASYLVTQRTRDIGVRMALGAAPGDISRQVVGEAVRWIVAGLALGCALAWVGARVVTGELYGIGSHDPASWIAALVLLCIALLLAVVRPSTRAARVDPMEALRAE